MRSRRGFTVAEVLAVLLLLLVVLQIGWGLTAAVARAAVQVAERSESLAASRATAWILQEELEGVAAPDDVSAPAGDSVSLRAFRGTGRVCGAGAPADVLVRWSGTRAPDPAKDSVLVLGSDGAWTTRALAARALTPGGCGVGSPAAAGVEERWGLDRPAPAALLLRVFERGSYHLADDAFRYRIGAGGRQPLTPANVDAARSSLTAAPPARVVLEVATRGSHLRRPGAAIRRGFSLPGHW